MLHDWELGLDVGVVDHWKELDCLVLVMILVMLGYNGTFYQLTLGTSPQILEVYLRSQTKQS
jgi:hypothetical protein